MSHKRKQPQMCQMKKYEVKYLMFTFYLNFLSYNIGLKLMEFNLLTSLVFTYDAFENNLSILKLGYGLGF